MKPPCARLSWYVHPEYLILNTKRAITECRANFRGTQRENFSEILQMSFSTFCFLDCFIVFKGIFVSANRVGRDRGAGDREKRGREVYGRGEKRVREAGFPRWWEAGEKGGNYATLRNISQSKKCKGAGANKYSVGTGIKGYGKREVYTPCLPPKQRLICSKYLAGNLGRRKF